MRHVTIELSIQTTLPHPSFRMTNALLSCTACNMPFRSRAALNNHVRCDHQKRVKVKYQNGNLVQVERGRDNAFKCGCGKVFKTPLSLQKHAKGCNGELVSLDDTLSNGEMLLSDEDDSDASESNE